MNKYVVGIIAGLFVFTATALSGFFVAWIGGMQPFTENAGWMSGLTIFMAGVFSAGTYGVIIDG